MRLQPIVYVTDMGRAVAFYERVLGVSPTYRSDVWTSFAVGGHALALHRVASLPPAPRGELSLLADEPLERIAERLAAAGVTPARGIQDETFGRSLLLADPDGSALQINEHDHA
jgi:predicted enzyme related to lactoylglutathione lyase